jgi:hypothetical protein
MHLAWHRFADVIRLMLSVRQYERLMALQRGELDPPTDDVESHKIRSTRLGEKQRRYSFTTTRFRSEDQ